MSPLALSLHFLQAQPDDRLVALARDGHAPAFEALVRRYRRELLAYCRRLQPRSGSAEDALQQTLLQAWKALSAGAEIRDVRPWLYRIAHNVSLNELRVAVSVPQDLSETAGANEVHQLVEQRLQARAALAGMAALPALQRDVFISTTLDGASHEQVASSLGLTSGAVRGLIYRARATLRSAAAGLVPSPMLHWAVRRAETRAGAAPAITEMLTGGGGAGAAVAIAKGSALLAMAGAIAGGGGAILTHASEHHRRNSPLEARSAAANLGTSTAGLRAEADARGGGSAPPAAVAMRRIEHRSGRAAPRGAAEHGRVPGSDTEAHRGSSSGSTGDHGGRSTGGPDGGGSNGTGGSSDGGSTPGAMIASLGDGGGGGGSDGSGAGAEGGSSGSGSTAASTGSGSDGGASSGEVPSGGETATTGATSGGSSGSGGGSSGSAGSSSGSGDTTTATSSH